MPCKGIADGDCTAHPVFVETITPPGTTIVAAIDAVDLGVALLGCNRRVAVNRVHIVEALHDGSRIHCTGVVKRQQESSRAGQRLQAAQIVGN